MSNKYENIAMLYLMNQDLSSLSITEIRELYDETVKQVKDEIKQVNKEKYGSTFCFDQIFRNALSVVTAIGSAFFCLYFF